MSRVPIELEIVSPEKQLFKGLVEWVQLPGAKAPFTVLCNHAPMVSTLRTGCVRWKAGNEEQQLLVKSGFVEIKNNNVSVCAEL